MLSLSSLPLNSSRLDRRLDNDLITSALRADVSLLVRRGPRTRARATVEISWKPRPRAACLELGCRDTTKAKAKASSHKAKDKDSIFKAKDWKCVLKDRSRPRTTTLRDNNAHYKQISDDSDTINCTGFKYRYYEIYNGPVICN